jgi:hypothetical protein
VKTLHGQKQGIDERRAEVYAKQSRDVAEINALVKPVRPVISTEKP